MFIRFNFTRSISYEAFDVLVRYMTFSIRSNLHVLVLDHGKGYLEENKGHLRKIEKMTTHHQSESRRGEGYLE